VEALQDHRIAPLHNLRICDACVGHVGVDPAPPMPRGALCQ
jgi:hypothetical protein